MYNPQETDERLANLEGMLGQLKTELLIEQSLVDKRKLVPDSEPAMLQIGLFITLLYAKLIDFAEEEYKYLLLRTDFGVECADMIHIMSQPIGEFLIMYLNIDTDGEEQPEGTKE